MTNNIKTRLLGKIEKRADGCWDWTGHRNQGRGYGQISINGRMRGAHRVAYKLFVGPIPAGLVLDHLCRNRACCNPDHLEVVTNRTNTLRGDTLPAACLAKTHCPKGHPYAGDNLYIAPKGDRRCRACQRHRDKHRARIST